MKNLTNIQKKYIIVIIIMTLLLGNISLLLQNSDKSGELKERDRKIGEITRVHKTQIEYANLPSQIERLGGTAEDFRRSSEKTLENIKHLQERFEYDILSYRCFKDQVNRLMNNKQVDEEFCMIFENLEQFRLKK